MDANALTIVIIIASIMVTPIYALATYVFSGASRVKGMEVSIGFLVFGSLMFWVCLSGLPRRLGLPGNLIVPAAWILPSAVLILRRQWFLDKSLSQKWLVGLQLFRAIGAVFLIEMTRGKIPGIFAYPAGIGDILVALAALAVLLRYRKATTIPPVPVFLVIVLGAADFLSAFFFGFTSSETPLQLFFPAVPNNVIVFPTGMIPLFLVPYAIFFHTLSALNYTMHDRNMAGGTTR
ncbi:MAG TPA: hypothetical protein VIT00_00545 [Terrimicrobiaceae bacterium]